MVKLSVEFCLYFLAVVAFDPLLSACFLEKDLNFSKEDKSNERAIMLVEQIIFFRLMSQKVYGTNIYLTRINDKTRF